MKNIDEALNEMNAIADDACDGKLTEAECKKRLDAVRKTYGDDLFLNNSIGELKNEPASKEKIRELRIIQAQGGTSEETFLEMARTGRQLRKRKLTQMLAVITAIVAAAALIISLISALKN